MLLDHKILLATDAAVILRCGVRRIYKMIESKEIYAYKDKDGRVWKISEQSILDYIKVHSQEEEKTND